MAVLSVVDGLGVALGASPFEQEVLRLSKGFALSVYDALYLELALQLDAKLAEAARASGASVHD